MVAIVEGCSTKGHIYRSLANAFNTLANMADGSCMGAVLTIGSRGIPCTLFFPLYGILRGRKAVTECATS